MIQKRLALIITVTFPELKMQILVNRAVAGAAFFGLEPEPTQFGRSRCRLLDFGLPELQHCISDCFILLQIPTPKFHFEMMPFYLAQSLRGSQQNLPETLKSATIFFIYRYNFLRFCRKQIFP